MPRVPRHAPHFRKGEASPARWPGKPQPCWGAMLRPYMHPHHAPCMPRVRRAVPPRVPPRVPRHAPHFRRGEASPARWPGKSQPCWGAMLRPYMHPHHAPRMPRVPRACHGCPAMPRACHGFAAPCRHGCPAMPRVPHHATGAPPCPTFP